MRERLTRDRGLLWFCAALGLQLAIIGGVIVTKQYTAETGTVVYLAIEPVDPRDPLRGDFVTYRYDISTLSRDTIVDPRLGTTYAPKPGDTLYVPLDRVGRVWVASYGASSRLPDVESGPYGPDTVFIRGRVDSVGATTVDVRYGIEEYFIPEGSGSTLPTDSKQMLARVVVDRKGAAQVEQILIDGRPWP